MIVGRVEEVPPYVSLEKLLVYLYTEGKQPTHRNGRVAGWLELARDLSFESF